jgi:hypothetical protein
VRLANVALPALIFICTAALLAIGHFYYAYSWSVFAFPLGAGLFLCVLCGAEVVRQLSVRRATALQIDANAPPLSVSGIAWMFALSVFLYGFGFLLGPALYLLACLRANGFSWTLSAGSAAVLPISIWSVFIKAMSIQLPIWPLWLD